MKEPHEPARRAAVAVLLLLAGTGVSSCVALTAYSEVVDRLPPDELIEVEGRRVH